MLRALLRLGLVASAAASCSGCFIIFLFDHGSEACPGEQRTTCRAALELGGSVCGTGAPADAYQALVTCACAGDAAPCSSECGTELCAGEAVSLADNPGHIDPCLHCLQTGPCVGWYSRCATD